MWDRLPGTAAQWRAAGFADCACYPGRTTPYYAGLVRSASPEDPVALQVVPLAIEKDDVGLKDPLGEHQRELLPGLVHVYQDRVLVMPTDRCAVNCRHCNRRWIRRPAENRRVPGMLSAWSEYVSTHSEIREVLITGGDPLTLPDQLLGQVLSAFSALPQIGVIRIGTRIPAVLPERITAALCDVLRAHHPVYLHTQFNCPEECTLEAAKALRKLADSGVNLGNQMVLLAGVNDSVSRIAQVNRWLVEQRCRPYYLFLPEPVRGTAHFWVAPRRALEIGTGLAAVCSGIMMPKVVVDTPDGGGKIPLTEATLVERNGQAGIVDLRGRWYPIAGCPT